MFEFILGAVGLVLSLLVTGWLYREFLIFFPEAQEPLDEITEAVEIPTHDEWDQEKIQQGLQQGVQQLDRKVRKLADAVQSSEVDVPAAILPKADNLPSVEHVVKKIETVVAPYVGARSEEVSGVAEVVGAATPEQTVKPKSVEQIYKDITSK